MLRDLRGGGLVQRRAIEKLYTDYAGRLRNYYLHHGAGSAEADDWVQETFIRVLRFVDTIRDDTRIAAWLWRTARNVMIDGIRRSGRGEVSDEGLADTFVDAGERPLDSVEREDMQDCVQRQFEQFSQEHPDRAQCLVWVTVDELSMQEVADTIGRSVGATREYISQCRKKLKPYLDPCLKTLE